MTTEPLVQRVLLLEPRGFCAGVERAVAIVRMALEIHGSPVYVRHEIVHNAVVVREMEELGAVFVDEIDGVPDGAVVIFSAHGVAPEVRRAAAGRPLTVIDATCPLVAKVHLEARRFAREGATILLIGHAGHDEVIGTRGEAPGNITIVSSLADADQVTVRDPDNVAWISQTTFSVSDVEAIVTRLRGRFPKLRSPAASDICYASENRQRAVAAVTPDSEVVLVVGSPNSSNARRLVEVAAKGGCRAYLVEDADEIDRAWLASAKTIAVTAGASTPERSVQRVLERLRREGITAVQPIPSASAETMVFPIPPELLR